MKISLNKHLILLCLIAFVTTAHAIRPLPNYLPVAPVASKAVADYTVADVIGVVFTTQSSLPNDHPFSGNKAKTVLKTDWPGAKIETNVDKLLEYLFLSENLNDEETIRGNLYWIMHEVMDLTNAEKVTAILRVYNTQSVIGNKRKIAQFACEVFPYLLDVELLALGRDLLDDATVLHTSRPEGRPARIVTVRGNVWALCRSYLLSDDIIGYVFNADDYSHINKSDRLESVYCEDMKNWMISNWATISTNVNNIKSNVNRKYEMPVLRVFDSRN